MSELVLQIAVMHLLDKLQKRVFKNAGPTLATSFEPLAYQWSTASVRLLYRYYFGIASLSLFWRYYYFGSCLTEDMMVLEVHWRKMMGLNAGLV